MTSSNKCLPKGNDKKHKPSHKPNKVSFDIKCLAGKWAGLDKEKRAWLISDMLDRLRIEHEKRKKVTIPAANTGDGAQTRVEATDTEAVAYWLGLKESEVKLIIKNQEADIKYRDDERTRLYSLALDPSFEAGEAQGGEDGVELVQEGAADENECKGNAAITSRQPSVTMKRFMNVMSDPTIFPRYSVARMNAMKYQVMAIYPVDPTKTGPSDSYRINVYEINGTAPRTAAAITLAIEKAKLVESGVAPTLKKANYWLYHDYPDWKNLALKNHAANFQDTKIYGYVKAYNIEKANEKYGKKAVREAIRNVRHTSNNMAEPSKSKSASAQIAKKIGERVQRRGFAYTIEHQGNEYITRFNWKEGAETNGFVAMATVYLRPTYHDIFIAADIRPAILHGPHLPAGFGKKGQDVFYRNVRPKFMNKGFTKPPYADVDERSINIKGMYDLGDRTNLTTDDLENINAFIHESFAAWIGTGPQQERPAKKYPEYGNNKARENYQHEGGYIEPPVPGHSFSREKSETYKGYYLMPRFKGEYFDVWRISPNEYVGRGDTKKEAMQVVDLILSSARVNAKAASTGETTTRKRGINIRVRPPGKKAWYWFNRNKDGKYVVKKEGVGRQFSWLDVGNLDTPGLQGLAFLVGFPANDGDKIKPGQEIKAKRFVVQKIWIEKAVLALPKAYTTKKLENAIKKKYGDDIMKKLKTDDKNIVDFKIMPKGNDYQIEITTRE